METNACRAAKSIIPFAQQRCFEFNCNTTHTVTVIQDADGNPWWVAKEVCDILGYGNSREAVRKHCKRSQKMTVTKRDGQRGGAQFLTIIPESDLYRLISRSKLPAAEQFEEWVFEEVLPTIRKTGSYQAAAPEMTDAEKLLAMAKGVIELNEKLEEARPKVEAFNHFIMTDGTLNLSSAAKVPPLYRRWASGRSSCVMLGVAKMNIRTSEFQSPAWRE